MCVHYFVLPEMLIAQVLRTIVTNILLPKQTPEFIPPQLYLQNSLDNKTVF